MNTKNLWSEFLIVESPDAEPNTIYFISPRYPYETESDWLKRCGVIRNVGIAEDEDGNKTK